MNPRLLRTATAALLLLSACGDSGAGGTGGGAPSEPRWTCIHAGDDYCTCFYDDGNLLLSDGQYEIDSCSTEEALGEGVCTQGDDSCDCVGFYCGADLELGTCSCSTINLITEGEFTVSECTDYAYCCIFPDTDLCFCGSLACDPGDTQVTSCSVETVTAVLDERDTEHSYVDVCSEPEAPPAE